MLEGLDFAPALRIDRVIQFKGLFGGMFCIKRASLKISSQSELWLAMANMTIFVCMFLIARFLFMRQVPKAISLDKRALGRLFSDAIIVF